ncbi:hypothetical protein ACNQVK_02850 [Mycobacterium sp. 134]|uniref:hypothetical protein n=1 Tax=Mycobacterium sp. 134 TaxID=3400425 RepID=UPI003AAD2FA6
MTTEVTATMVIGPIDVKSYHGQPHGDRKLFCPSHTLMLMEGSRATWIVQPCRAAGQGSPDRARIRPSDPHHLLPAALLGYVTLTRPELLDGSDRLRAVVEVDPTGSDVRILPLDDDLVDHAFEVCAPEVYALVTTLPGSSIYGRDVRLAAAHGLHVAASGMPAVDLAGQRT